MREALAGGIAGCRRGTLIIALPAAAATARDAALCLESGMDHVIAGSFLGETVSVGQYIRNFLRLRDDDKSKLLPVHFGDESAESTSDKSSQVPIKASLVEDSLVSKSAVAKVSETTPLVLIVSADLGRRKVILALLKSCASAIGLTFAGPLVAQFAADGVSARASLDCVDSNLIFIDAELATSGWLTTNVLYANSPVAAVSSQFASARSPYVVIMSPVLSAELPAPQTEKICTDTLIRSCSGTNTDWAAAHVVLRPVSRDSMRCVLAAWMVSANASALPRTVAPETDAVVPTVVPSAPAIKEGFVARILVVEGNIHWFQHYICIPFLLV